jgi:integrase
VKTDVVWYAVKRYAKRIGLDHLAPHDLRRTCARLCHEAGGELEQIQFLLGHASVQTTERYIGCKNNLKEAVNDRFQITLGRRASSRPKKAHDNPVYRSLYGSASRISFFRHLSEMLTTTRPCGGPSHRRHWDRHCEAGTSFLHRYSRS